MQFERLDINNFGCYKGEHSIDLTCSEDKPVIIIIGDNGTGKSTLFDALNWALYGKEYEKDIHKKRERKIQDFLNESAIGEAADNGSQIEMYSTLYFEHEGRHYYITQILSSTVKSDGKESIALGTIKRETNLCEIRGGNHKKIPYDSIFLDEVLPSNVRDYFLFDGDRIHNLSKPGSSKEIRDAIYRVVDLEIIKNAHEHLHQIASEYRKLANKETKGELGEVERKYNEAYEELAEKKHDEEELKQEKIAINDQLEQLTATLQNLPDSQALQNNRFQADTRMNDLIGRDIELSVEIRSSAAAAALGIGRDPAKLLLKEINQRREKGLIPKKISQTLLKDLIEIQKCICGTEFAEGDDIYQALNTRLAQEKKGASGQEYIDLLISLEKSLDKIVESKSSLTRQVHEKFKANEEIRELDLIIKQIDEELEELPQEDIAKLTAEAKHRRNDLVTIGTKLGRIAAQIENIEQQISRLENEREELSKKQTKARALHLREGLAQKACNEFERIYEVFAEDSRKEVEKLTKQEFAQFVRSGKGYVVEVNEDYELQVIDSHGNPALQRLSMGQSQCLSLSFITAISRVSEKYPPLVIDMPFGRLDNKVDNEVSKRLPQISSQIILFLLDEKEWYETTRSNLKPVSSHIYELDFDEKRRETSIRVVL